MKAKYTLYGPSGARLHIDESQAFANDPGQGTPALLEWKGNFGTYWCCCEEGICGDASLPRGVVKWLNSEAVVKAVESIVWS